MKRIRKEAITRTIEELVKKANFSLREDILKLLKESLRKESPKSRRFLEIIIENQEIASFRLRPLCQDTGLPLLFVEIPRDFLIPSNFKNSVIESLTSAYKKYNLRSSIVEPLARKTPSWGPGIVHWEVGSSKFMELSLLVKGFGSENKSVIKMFNPTSSVYEIEEFVVETVKDIGPDACPPYIIGVGIGGTADYAMILSKKALLERFDLPNSNRDLSKIEKRILRKVNALGIGVMGLGGRVTCLGVRIKTYPTHIGGLPVALNISCHALRSATLRL